MTAACLTPAEPEMNGGCGYNAGGRPWRVARGAGAGIGKTKETSSVKILVAVDDSACSKRMLAYLVSHEPWSEGRHEWTVFHGVQPLPHRAAALSEPDTVKAYYESDAERVLRPVRAFLQRHGIQATFLHKVCAPGHEIARLARPGRFDLVILGSHGRGAVGSAVLGSVAQKVLAQTRTPVLVVR
jgi:nucleotide-binding universal stress UspA family protein